MADVRFRAGGDELVGSWTDDGIEHGATIYDPHEVTIVSPVAGTRIIGVGVNHGSVLERRDRYPEPEDASDVMLYVKPATTLSADGDTVTLPNHGHFAYETELGVMVAERCRDVDAADAMDVVAGFTCVNDITNYDVPDYELTGLRAQGTDGTSPVGPVVASPDDVPEDAHMELVVDGDVVVTMNRSEYLFGAAELIAEITGYLTLLPGDVISMGTAAGYEHPADGDTVEVAIEGIGTLETNVRIDTDCR